MERTPLFAEFFAGIGLIRLALKPLGWECVFANDFDPSKARVYAENFTGEHLVVENINRVTSRNLPVGLTLVTACFPCIDLSLAGNRAGLAGEHSGTFWPFVKILKGLKREGRPAPLLLIENVEGFLSSNGGHDLETAIKALNDVGYRCDAVIADARHFTPQSRKRLLIIGEHVSSPFGVLRGAELFEAEHELRPPRLARFMAMHGGLNWGRADLPALPRPSRSLKDVLEKLPSSSPLWWSEGRVRHLLSTLMPLHRAKLRDMLAAKGESVATVYRRTRFGKGRAELRTDGLAGCLRTPRGGSSKQFLLVTRSGNTRVRNLTPLEYGRLQGVWDEEGFVPSPNVNEALFGFGDGVCVPLVRWIAQNAFRAVTRGRPVGDRELLHA